jgi:acetyl-CoA carboxylase carboxyl transferase subunit beta
MDLFSRRRQELFKLKGLRRDHKKDVLVVEETRTCPLCTQKSTLSSLEQGLHVCPCGYHFLLDAPHRLQLILDKGSAHELYNGIKAIDWLDFPGYADKLKTVSKRTGLSEGVTVATGRIDGRRAVVAVMDSRFLMGSMGSAVGERITRAIEYAHRRKLPLIIFTASGGARMQEGIISLMQMAKVSAAVERFSQAGGLYIVCLTHPTTGGVTASFAMLGDITLAEPGALIGFAGPRVIEQTIHQTLPDGFQRSEFLEEHGFIDRIVQRHELRATLSQLLRLHTRKGGIS